MRARFAFATAVTLAALAGACNSGEKPDSAGAAAGVAARVPAGVGPVAAEGWSDANIFYLLDGLNGADSAKAALAVTKGTSTEVRAFAKMMMRDHHQLRQLGLDLAKRLSVQLLPPAGDSMVGNAASVLSKLQAAAKGRDFDKAYIDQEVGAHREMLSLAVSAAAVTRNSELKNLIQKSAPVVQSHLDHAQAIQKNLQK